MLVDSHCHLDMLDAAAVPAILRRAHDAGVTEMVSIGTRLGQSAALPALVADWAGVWCTVGVHPLHVGEAPLAGLDDLLALSERPKVVGIGESGLDYHYEAAPAAVQEASFRTHIRAARAAGLPLVVHARDADADIARILHEEREAGGPFGFVLHCFSSGRALAERGIAMGGYVSFSGILTFPKSHELREIARDLPADKLLVETDAPYLAPVPHRGKTNEPGWTAHTARVLAEVRGLAPDALAALTTANFRRLFPPGGMTLTVTVLGCGGSAGVPHIGGADGRGDWGACDPAEPRNRRTRSSIVIAGAEGRVLVDTSPDMRSQLLDCAVPGVDAIVFTHAHADHILGLDDARILNRIANRPLDAIGTETTLAEIAGRFDYAFRPWQPPYFFRPVLVPRPVQPGDTIIAGGLTLETYDQDHGFIRTLGLRVGAFAYSTDVVALDEASFSALAGIDTWLVGCFQRTPHRTHAHFDLVVDWSRRLGVRRTVLTHMGNDMDWSWIASHAPAGLEAGYDGQVLMVE